MAHAGDIGQVGNQNGRTANPQGKPPLLALHWTFVAGQRGDIAVMDGLRLLILPGGPLVGTTNPKWLGEGTVQKACTFACA